MKRFIAVILAASLSVSFLFGCSGKKKTEKEEISVSKEEMEIKEKQAEEILNSDDETVTVIGDVKITQSDYNFIYKVMYDQMSSYKTMYGDKWMDAKPDGINHTIGEYMKISTIDQYHQLIAASILGKELGITADNKDVAESIKAEKKRSVETYGSTEKYNAFLKESRTTDETVDKYLEYYEIYSRVFEKLMGNGKEEKKEALKTFNDEYIKVQYIFVSLGEVPLENNSAIPQKSDAEAEFVANTVIERLDGGEDFLKLMEIYNEDSAIEKDKPFLITEESADKELFEAAKKLSFGKYTKKPVKTSSGYYVVKRYEVDESEENFNEYFNAKSSGNAMEKISEKMMELPVKTKDDKLDKYISEWIKELEGK